MEVVDNEGRQLAKKSRVELLSPDNDWGRSFHLSRLKGMSTETRSFNFKLLHQLLPLNQRLDQILPNNQADCSLCTLGQIESPQHCFFSCDYNSEAAQYLVHLTRPYDLKLTEERILLFDIKTADANLTNVSIWAQLHLAIQGGQEEDLSLPDQGRTEMSFVPSAKDPVKGAEGSWKHDQ